MLETPKDLYTLVLIRNHSNIFKYNSIWTISRKPNFYIYFLDINKVGSSETTCETLIFFLFVLSNEFE
jgi:hypothetical protein